MLPTITTMLLLRHGQSEWNAIRRWQGAADTPLTPLGQRQAEAAAGRLASLEIEFGGPWASDLGRAEATASTIAAMLDIGPTIVDRRLREASAGEWEGMTPDEIELRYPGWLAAHRRPATFEPFEQVVGRTLIALRTIAAQPHRPGAVPLVVTHSGVIRSIIRHLGGVDTRIPNLGGVWLSIGSVPSPIEATSGHVGDRSVDALDPDGISVGDLFDPGGLVSGIDIPGEDPR